jgi:glucuronate isomerase
MKTFMDENFLLDSDTAVELYSRYAAALPIIDYHCHLDPHKIAENYRFEDITEAWLGGDHYKWRAMRANGIEERLITGDASPTDKFEQWAATMPYLMRNPLYHWTHLELSRIFGIDEILNPNTAGSIYSRCTELLRTPDFSVRELMRRMKVELVCTTDDPADDLKWHEAIKNDKGFNIRVLPTWRPDKAASIENPAEYNSYIGRLEKAAGVSILTFDNLLEALQTRHDYFAAHGCLLSDHGMEKFSFSAFTLSEARSIFLKIRGGQTPEPREAELLRSALLYEGACMDAKAGWVQQFHIGANRNNNSRMFRRLGADAGFDAIADHNYISDLNRFLDRLDGEDRLAKTIVYNLNPRDNAALAANIYNFNDGSVAGKMQYGAAWWFLDNIKGMEEQIETLSSLGLLSRFVGMLTDSRSFLSYPRHEYFRRILCNMLGNDVEKGRLPASELLSIAKIVKNVCYYNAKSYF